MCTMLLFCNCFESVMLSGVSSSMVNILAVGILRPVIMGLETLPLCRDNGRQREVMGNRALGGNG